METRSKRKRLKLKEQENLILIEKKKKESETNAALAKKSYGRRKQTSAKSEEDEMSNNDKINGLVFSRKYVPEELLIEILCHIDYKTLVACQLVCKRWQILIQRYVWHKKAEKSVGRELLFDKRTPWIAYYCLCSEMPFNKNLVKNHSGEKGPRTHWKYPPRPSIHWYVESPPVPPLPDDPSFNENSHCFVTSYGITSKFQTVDLIKEGFSKYVLDHLQPTIKISEWYSCQNAPAMYLCNIQFLKGNGDTKFIIYKSEYHSKKRLHDSFTFCTVIESGQQNKWFKHEYEIKNYGRGLRKIKYIHGGKDIYQNDDHNGCGSKMAKACIKVDIPPLDYEVIAALPKYN